MDHITKNHYEEAKKIDISEVLENYGLKNLGTRNNKKYNCIYCNGNNLNVVKRTNKVKCFNCNKYSSNIDIVMYIEKVDQFQAIRKLLNMEIMEPMKKKKENFEVQEQNETYLKELDFSVTLSKNNIGYIKKYFNDRGLNKGLEILKKFDFIEIRHRYNLNKNHVIYNFPNDNFLIKKSIDRTFKSHYGSPKPITFKIKESNIFYLVEGIEDAISIIQFLNENVICLNSTSNKEIFKKNIMEHKEYKIIFALDNDNEGIKTGKELKEFFIENNIDYDYYLEFYKAAKKIGIKDINDFLTSK